MFNPQNRVDLDTNSYKIPPNVIVISGSNGGRGCFARIYCSPDSIAHRFLPAPSEVTEDEERALYCFAAIKSEKYRRDKLQRYKVTEDMLASLENRGLLKSNKAGHRQITTEGRNARGKFNG